MKLKKAETTGSVAPFAGGRQELVDVYRYLVQFDALLEDLDGFTGAYKLSEYINNACKEI